MNAFTDLSRDARLSLNIEGFCTKLRAPEVLARLVMEWKPTAYGLGDHTLTSLLNDFIHGATVRRDYRAIQRTLDTLFGRAGDESARQGDVKTPVVTAGTNGDGRSRQEPRR